MSLAENPTMRYLSRTQGLNLRWLYERFQSPELELMYEVSSNMAADIFTKSFTDKVKWLEVCRLVNIVDKDVFYDLIAHSHAPSVAQTAGGGTARDQPATPAPHPAPNGQTIESSPPSECKPVCAACPAAANPWRSRWLRHLRLPLVRASLPPRANPMSRDPGRMMLRDGRRPAPLGALVE